METNIQQVNLITIIILIGSVIFHYILFLKNNSEAKEKKASIKRTNKSSAYKAITVPHAFETQYLKACSTNELDNEENTNSEVIKNVLPNQIETSHLIRTRRSIFPKDFSETKKVPLDVIKDILASANWAPTHGKTEPWRFCVIGPETMKKLLDIRLEVSLNSVDDEVKKKKIKSKIERKRKELQKCSAIIFICVKRVLNARDKMMPQWEENASVAMAVENLHLQLTAYWNEGYGGYWSSSGWNNWLMDSRVRTILNMNESLNGEEDLILGAFYLGVSNVKKMNAYKSSRTDMSKKILWMY